MWLFFASLNPVSETLKYLFSKQASVNTDPAVISFWNNFIPALVFFPILFFIDLKLSAEFFISMSISGIINLTAVILYHKAISTSDLSAVVPILSFTPLFLLITSPIFLGEFPSITGLIGVLLIVAGSYLLHVNGAKGEWLMPFRLLLTHKGSRYMFIVAFIWSISSNFDKRAINASSVLQYIVCINLFIFVVYSIYLAAGRRFTMKEVFRLKKNTVLVGVFTATSYIFHMTALSMTLVAYVVALKRTTGMLSVAVGHYVFKEKHLRERLLGTIIMFIGILLIIFSAYQ